MVQSLLRKWLPTEGGRVRRLEMPQWSHGHVIRRRSLQSWVVAHSCSFKEILECAEVKASVDRHSVQALRLVFEFTERKRRDPVIPRGLRSYFVWQPLSPSLRCRRTAESERTPQSCACESALLPAQQSDDGIFLILSTALLHGTRSVVALPQSPRLLGINRF